MLDSLRHYILVNDVQRALVDDETVRVNMARDQGLAETPSSLNHNLRRVPVNRVHSERYTRATRVNHLLDSNADQYFLVREALLLTIEYGSWGVEARPALLNIV